mgnify:CR=1 FL=1
MNVITEYPIEIRSGAAGKEKLDAAKEKAKKAGYFSKERREDRKEDRIEKKTERIEKRTERKLARKAKHGARPLNSMVVGGLKKFKDNLPKIRKTANGAGVTPCLFSINSIFSATKHLTPG